MSTPPRPEVETRPTSTPYLRSETVESEAIESETLIVPPLPELLGIGELPPLDPEAVVEEAEQLLRESAPHDFDVLVIGAGPGGYGAAIRAAQLGARVGLVTEGEIGGGYLNECLPTKTLLEAAHVLHLVRRAADYGIHLEGGAADFRMMHARGRDVARHLRENVTQLLETHSVTVIRGLARFVEEHTVEITDEGGTTRRVCAVDVVIATGSTPHRLAVTGCDLAGVMTSAELLQDATIPASLVVVGAGAVGLELACLFRELGAHVTLIEPGPDILPGEDNDVSRALAHILAERGIKVVTSATLRRIEQQTDILNVIYKHAGRLQSTAAARVLLATARRANTNRLGLDGIGIEHEAGQVVVDEHCATSVHGVYAVGECVRPDGWAHQADAEGRMVAEVIMKHPATVDLRHLPRCYYTNPEIASVGSTEAAAAAEGRPTRTGVYHFRDNARALAGGEPNGFVKVVIDEESHELLGCQIIGPRATELINEAVLALTSGHTLGGLEDAIHALPTFGEALPAAVRAARLGTPGFE